MTLSLPEHLQERCHWVRRQASCGSDSEPREFVLYWMHNALRVEENPALDVAVQAARELDLPLLIYQGLCEEYPFASDRHHAFIMQGARDVQRHFAESEIRYVFHLQRPGFRGAYLKQLARRAGLLVTEDLPVEPLRGWVDRLSQRVDRPIVAVDTACLIPMRRVAGFFHRAFQFRKATEAEFARRLPLPWRETPLECEPFQGAVPFQPLDLQNARLDRMIGNCRIDHSVVPLAETRGGTLAGYRRWRDFVRDGLERYDRCRNDAVLAATSGMSPYLHYGMVSPMRLARESYQAGAEKFLDELLIWRELSFHFCLHHADDLDTMAGLPDWARRSLEEHAEDPRPLDGSWEVLARAKTGDPLWDACQQSLVRHGQLHNNVRMTWGKAFLHWTRTPSRALQMAIDLNHRFALDGRGPCSYGGLLWCFGQFDRPFKPPQPITGTVRERSLVSHSQRIDLPAFRKRIHRPIAEHLPRVAVVGAGVAGLIAARTLTDYGVDVQVFEKSRGVGGRLATRPALTAVTFDHGTQFFTARESLFQRFLRSWLHDGLVQPWLGRIVHLENETVAEDDFREPRFVGVPTMNHLAKHLAADLSIHLNSFVHSVQRCAGGHQMPDGWRLCDAQGDALGEFDVVLINCPPAQATHLLPADCSLANAIGRAQMLPRWAAMIHCEVASRLDYDAAFVRHSPLAWIARNNAKPRRHPSGQSWVLHANHEWSEEHLGEDREEIVPAMLDAFEQATGVMLSEPTFAAAHRWLYAVPHKPLDQPCLWDASEGLGAGGDWCGEAGVEGAFLSGIALAGSLLRHLTIDRAPAAC